jgi:hypothetical protein
MWVLCAQHRVLEFNICNDFEGIPVCKCVCLWFSSNVKSWKDFFFCEKDYRKLQSHNFYFTNSDLWVQESQKIRVRSSVPITGLIFKTREQTFLTATIITLITQVSMKVSFTSNTFCHNIYTHLFCTNYLKYSSRSYDFFSAVPFSFEYRDCIRGIVSSCVLFALGIMSVCGDQDKTLDPNPWLQISFLVKRGSSQIMRRQNLLLHPLLLCLRFLSLHPFLYHSSSLLFPTTI